MKRRLSLILLALFLLIAISGYWFYNKEKNAYPSNMLTSVLEGVVHPGQKIKVFNTFVKNGGAENSTIITLGYEVFINGTRQERYATGCLVPTYIFEESVYPNIDDATRENHKREKEDALGFFSHPKKVFSSLSVGNGFYTASQTDLEEINTVIMLYGNGINPFSVPESYHFLGNANFYQTHRELWQSGN